VSAAVATTMSAIVFMLFLRIRIKGSTPPA